MDTNELKKKLIEDKIFRNDGGLNSVWFIHKAKNYDLSELDGDTPQEKIYILFNGRKTCCICGKNTPFRNWKYGFLSTCSKECKREFDRRTLSNNLYKLKTEEVKEKRKKTTLKKYGVENVFQSEDIKNKSKESLIKHFGVEHPMYSDEVKEKIIETNRKKYGADYYTQTEEYKEKTKETCLEKYNNETYFGSKDYKEKTKSFWMNKLGVDSNFKDKCVQEKIKETNNILYGVDYPMQNMELRKKSLSKHSRTIPEKKIEEFLINRGFQFEEQYTVNNKCFDFAIFKNNNLSILVEVDGEYFHGLLEDANDKHVKGYNDCERFLETPENVKLIVVDSKRIESAFDEILEVFDMSYDSWINSIVESLPKEFPYYSFTEERMKKDYDHLKTWEDIKPKGRLCDSIITNFHKSIYSAHVGNNPSPVEAWNNKDLLEKCVKNRFIYSSSLSSHSILQGFNVCKIAPKVSVFSASLAKYLIRKYLDNYNEVFDPFSGFSGRMIGTLACGKKYIGQDINPIHIKESAEIAEFLNKENFYTLECSLAVVDILGDFDRMHDCLFTCPPYGDKEIWSDNYINFSCDKWIEICLSKYKCNKYLFVVDNTEKYKDSIVEEISNKSHFSNSKEYVILINNDY